MRHLLSISQEDPSSQTNCSKRNGPGARANYEQNMATSWKSEERSRSGTGGDARTGRRRLSRVLTCIGARCMGEQKPLMQPTFWQTYNGQLKPFPRLCLDDLFAHHFSSTTSRKGDCTSGCTGIMEGLGLHELVSVHTSSRLRAPTNGKKVVIFLRASTGTY